MIGIRIKCHAGEDWLEMYVNFVSILSFSVTNKVYVYFY